MKLAVKKETQVRKKKEKKISSIILASIGRKIIKWLDGYKEYK